MIVACTCGQKNRAPDDPVRGKSIVCGKCRKDLTTRVWLEQTVAKVKGGRLQHFADMLDVFGKGKRG